MKYVTVIVAISVLFVGCVSAKKLNGDSRQSDPTSNDALPLPTRYLMRGLVAIHFENLRSRLASDVATSDGEQRESIAMSATLLQEASSLLMRSPPKDDQAWIVATSRLLRGGSEGILAAIAASDIDEARKAFLQMRHACSACHRDCPADLRGEVRPGY